MNPRPCQRPMIEAMTRLDRCNVFASPGTGKTSATLLSLDALSLVGDDVWPVLVMAPLRVANSVWHAEVAKWARFTGLRVSRVLGSADERQAALRAPADIYTINPANLVWLHAEVGSRWPFKTVICDESTSIKNHRVHYQRTKTGKWAFHKEGKSKNACALVRHAPTTPRWINLTGTPTPNGVENLWGQCWPIDFGKALGSSHKSFTERWFRPAFGSTPEQARFEPLPGAEDEILARVKPFSVSVDAYNYFDIDKPVELDMLVDLPPEARAMYNQMHRTSVVEIKKTKSVGANAGAALMKCRQIASGHLRDVEDKWHTVHTAKLDALQELRDKLDGQPLLVAYYFKEDAKAIMGRFKDAVMLPKGAKQQEIESRWNDGKIQMLVVNIASAAHGLNLQYGGNNLCIYTMDWNAEYYEQVIERLGPTRQEQAGFKRLVYVHRIVAHRTWEQVILKRLGEKFDVTQLVKDALAMLD